MKTESPTVAEMQLIESRVANDKKSVGVAYGLWFFLGLWGIHNFYLGKTKTALFQLLGGAAAIVLLLSGGLLLNLGSLLGVLVLVAWALSFFCDMFLIPGRVKRNADALRANLSHEMVARR